MDFRALEALFFGDNFFKLVTIWFQIFTASISAQAPISIIWSLNKISNFRVPVIDP